MPNSFYFEPQDNGRVSTLGAFDFIERPYFSFTKSKTKIAQTPTVTVWLDHGESRNSVIYSSHHAEPVRRDFT
jgi:hypothetical protein